VRHGAATKTALTNNARKGAYSWEARFLGVHKKIKVNGVPQRVRIKIGQRRQVHVRDADGAGGGDGGGAGERLM